MPNRTGKNWRIVNGKKVFHGSPKKADITSKVTHTNGYNMWLEGEIQYQGERRQA